MGRIACLTVCALQLASLQPAQQPTRILCGPPVLSSLLAAPGVGNGMAAAAGSGQDLALAVLGHLRRGDAARSRAALADADASSGEDACWLAVARLWHARATGSDGMSPAAGARLLRRLADVRTAPPDRAFVAEAVRAHALLATGALLGGAAGDAWTTNGIQRLLALETGCWHEPRGAFRNRTAVPDAPSAASDVATLLPAAAGLLLATGDRMSRHLGAVLADTAPIPGTTSPLAAAWRLAAATQLLDDAHRASAWRELAAAATASTGDANAWLVDAALFAVTGVRLATGAGIDEAWQRFAPWLPPGCDRLVVRNLLAGGGRYDLDVEARDGPLRDDERDGTAHLGGAGRRLFAIIALRSSHDGAGRAILVSSASVQTMHWLAPGETFACSLPCAQPQPDQDPGVGLGDRPLLGGRCQ
jgi:hypothetical protein